MSFCPNCQKENVQGSAFCNYCGTPLNAANAVDEEQDFIDTTYRILRWERNAWKISGIALLIFGIVFGVLFFIFGIVFSAIGEEIAFVFSSVFFTYSFVFGGVFIACGIVSLISAKKIPFYLNSMYNDFSMAFKRCDNVGMLILTIFFNSIAMVFFIINFVRMKANRNTIGRIIARQQGRI